MGRFFDELKRRNVVRVAVAYLIFGWLVIQIGEALLPGFGAPDWVFKTMVLFLAIGFPFLLLFAWAFELTPDGIKKTRDVNLTTSVTASTGRKLDFAIIGALVIALGYFVWDRQQLIDAATPAAEPVAETDTAPPDAASPSDVQPAEADTKRRSIAVLPFVNMSSDAEQEWFVDGLTEELLNSLARTPDLLVAARTSSFNYKDSDEDIPEIAKALGVEHILEGSVRRSGDRLRVTAQLIRADDGFHLWSENYDRTMDDVIQIQEEVAIQIANALETAMDPEALARMVSAGTSSVPAYEAYLQGLTFGVSSIASGDIYEFLNAREAYERAIELDPEFAFAYRRLALFWRLQMITSNISFGLTELSTKEIRAQYEKAIDNAIRYEKDPVLRIADRADKAYAEMKFLQALRLNTSYLEQRPNDHDAQAQQLDLYQTLGMYDEAVVAVAEFYERDGYSPIVTVQSILSLLYGDHRDVLHEFTEKSVERFADNVNVLYQAHRALLWAGDIDGASRILPLVQASDMEADNRALATLRQACAEGKTALGTRIFDQILRDYPDEVAAVWLSRKIMGRDDEALQMLQTLDNAENMTSLASFYGYGHFDARQFPHLLAILEAQGIDPYAAKPIPYQCKT
jgi:TolB-like protein